MEGGRARSQNKAQFVYPGLMRLDSLGLRQLQVMASDENIKSDPMGKTIVVTGAGGRTGSKLCLELENLDLGIKELRCVVHSFRGERKLQKLQKLFNTYIADIYRNPENLAGAMEGADTLVILTSAMPKIKKRSIAKLGLAKLFRRKLGRPSFRYKQTPEQVDWIGQKNQIDMAKEAGVKHVVLVSSMGGTDPNNSLNKIGDGNILLWKRKAEQYLINSGLKYTIIHPGGLTDSKTGVSMIPIAGVDDELLARNQRSISRADLVDIVGNAIFEESAIGKSFDVIASEEIRDDDYDWGGFFNNLSHCDYSTPDVEEVLAAQKAVKA